MANDYGTCNRDYFIQQYPDLADVFRPKTKSQQTLAQPTPRKPRRTVAPLPLRAPERAGDVILVFLPMPPKELSPNSRAHWKRKASLVQATRGIAALQARKVALSEPWTKAVIDIKAWTANRHDEDNLIAACKAMLDGVAEGLGMNDRHFTIGTVRQFTGKQSEGRREIEFQITNLSHVA
jgi:crossover junction endodeoxyribonuclease RusA